MKFILVKKKECSYLCCTRCYFEHGDGMRVRLRSKFEAAYTRFDKFQHLLIIYSYEKCFISILDNHSISRLQQIWKEVSRGKLKAQTPMPSHS